MTRFASQGYSRYVSLMKVLLPAGILISIGLAIGWPYLQSLNKENVAAVDASQPDIRENRMVKPHYTSTDKKNQPFQVDADWGTQKDNLADLINPHGSMAMLEGQTFNLKAQKGKYDSQTKVLNLEGKVTLTSTDGYHVQTERASVAIDNKIIEGNEYVEGEGPAGEIMGTQGFKVENRPQGKKIITLKGPSRVVINEGIKLNKRKKPDAQ